MEEITRSQMIEVGMKKEIVAEFDYDAANHLLHVLERAIGNTPYNIREGKYDNVRVLLPPCKLDVKTLRW